MTNIKVRKVVSFSLPQKDQMVRLIDAVCPPDGESHYLEWSVNDETAIVLFALVAAFGLVTVVAVDIVLTAQEAEAQQRGCKNSVAVNASRGKCLK